LAGAFASAGLSVLVVDADPQASLSQGFFGSTLVENLPAEETLASLFAENSFFSDHESVIRSTAFDGISICPTNQLLSQYNTPCPGNGDLHPFALREFIAQRREFDVVLIDCPPNLYVCSWTAMVAADFVVIPVPPEDFGTQGLRTVHQAIDNARALNPSLQLLGHVVTRSDRRLLVHRSYEARLRELYSEKVLTTVVPEASAFKVSLACRKPVEYYSRKSQAAKLTRQLSREILDRIAVTNKQRSVA
jgi:chromosome partitioning protein